jgi:hypothetical protein
MQPVAFFKPPVHFPIAIIPSVPLYGIGTIYCIAAMYSSLLPLTLLIAILGFASPVGTVAQPRRIITDKGASFLWADVAAKRIHVLTAGVDANFDGIFQTDSGDIAPRWFVIDAVSERVVDSATFDGFFNAFPLRPAVDERNKHIYLPQGGRIREYDMQTLKQVRDSIITGSPSAVMLDTANNRLLCSFRPGFSKPGYVVCLRASTGDTLFIAPTAVSPMMSGAIPGGIRNTHEYYTLDEGTGGPDATLSYSLLEPDIFSAANDSNLIGGAFHIISSGDRAFIAVNGMRRVFIIDTRTHKNVVPAIPVGTGAPQGMNGPQALALYNDTLLVVPTFYNKLFTINATTGEIRDSFLVRSRIESVALRDSFAFAAMSFGLGTNNADSLAVMINLNSHQIVDTLPIALANAGIFIDKRGDLHSISYNEGGRRWRVTDRDSLKVKASRNFFGLLENPCRLSYSSALDSVFLVVNDTLFAYSALDLSAPPRVLFTNPKSPGKITGVTLTGGYLLVPEAVPANDTTRPGAIYVLNTDGSFVAKFTTGQRPTMAAAVTTKRPRAISFYGLDRGIPATRRSILSLFEFQPNIFEPTDTLGSLANHLLVNKGGIGVTMNGSHQIIGISPDSWRIYKRWGTKTSGFDGPRETLIQSDSILLFTTYAGDIRVLRQDSSVQVFPIGGKGEGLAMIDQKVFVAVPFTPSYAADSVVVVFDFNQLLASVTRQNSVASTVALQQNYPNPAQGETTIGFSLKRTGHVRLDLHSVSGELVATLIDRTMEPGDYSVLLQSDRLPAGSYLYSIATDGSTLSRTMQIIR